jgi:hypothetical protein
LTKSKSISFAELTLLNERFIKVVVNPNSEIHPEHLEEIWLAYNELVGHDSKFSLLTILPEDLYISPNTKKVWADSVRSERKHSEAFVINGLGLKLIANFVVKFHKPSHNMRYFNSEEKALNWLEDLGIEPKFNTQIP